MTFVVLYWKYICMFFRSRAEYKLSFFMGLVSNFYCYFITYITFWVITKKFHSIGGWDFNDISILYSMNLLTWAISGTLFWQSIYFLEQLVTTGGLDRFLLRPIGIIKQLVCSAFGYTFLGQIVVCFIFLGRAFFYISYKLTLLNVVYMIFAIIGGVLLQAGILIIVGALSFWIQRSTPIGQVICYDLRGLVNYPMNIYPRVIKIILTFIVPWGFVNYYPSVILLNKPESSSEIILGLITPFIGIFIFIMSLLIFNQGLKRYNGSGN